MEALRGVAGRDMQPENDKTDASPVGEPKAVDPKTWNSENTSPSNPVQPPEPIPANPVQSEPVSPRMTERKFAQVSRRELLKVLPVLALGAFAVPRFQQSLLKKGLAFSDWASALLFRRGHLAPTFQDAEVTPFEKFPINGYDVDDPGVIFENWSLTVSAAVQMPGEYKLGQIQALPRIR